MLVFNENTGYFFKVNKNNIYEPFYRCLQELLLWRGENPMDAERGVDYFAVFDNRKLLRNEITMVLDRYRDSFKLIDIVDLRKSEDSETIHITLNFLLPDDTALKVTLSPKKGY